MQEIVQASHILSSKGICESNKQLSGQFEDGEGWCQGISLLREVVLKSKICGKKKKSVNAAGAIVFAANRKKFSGSDRQDTE